VLRPETEPTLDDVRREIARIDRTIVCLVAARLRAARRAIRLRVAAGEDLTDRDQEAVVLERAQQWAEELGVPQELAGVLLQALIDAGKGRGVVLQRETAPTSRRERPLTERAGHDLVPPALSSG
jgi:chorismate mutase